MMAYQANVCISDEKRDTHVNADILGRVERVINYFFTAHMCRYMIFFKIPLFLLTKRSES